MIKEQTWSRIIEQNCIRIVWIKGPLRSLNSHIIIAFPAIQEEYSYSIHPTPDVYLSSSLHGLQKSVLTWSSRKWMTSSMTTKNKRRTGGNNTIWISAYSFFVNQFASLFLCALMSLNRFENPLKPILNSSFFYIDRRKTQIHSIHHD